MNLKEALDSDTEYEIAYKGVTLYFTLRNPTSAEDLEYRRRSQMTTFKNGKFESRDQALNAPLWLLEQVKVKVEYSNGSAERLPVSDEDYRNPGMLGVKKGVIAKHYNGLEGEEAEKIKN